VPSYAKQNTTIYSKSADEFVKRQAKSEVRVRSSVKFVANIKPFERLNTLCL